MEQNYILEAAKAARELIETADMQPGQILVVGCSSSEVEGCRLALPICAALARIPVKKPADISLKPFTRKQKKEGSFLPHSAASI